MKILHAILLFVTIAFLSSCTTPPTSTVMLARDLKLQIKEDVPTPQQPQPQKPEPQQPEPQQLSEDKEILFQNIVRKARRLDYDGLRLVNDIIDTPWEQRADPNLEIVLMMVKKEGFPAFLEKILQTPRLVRIPRDRSALVILESEKNPGVQNVFIEVPAEYMHEDDSIYDWMPDMALWVKYVDLKANLLTDRTPKEAFLSLFWMANKVKNPELMKALEQKNWDWAKMPHPKDTVAKKMYIPIATLEKNKGL
ncbi:MAG: hypothetical protein UU98_C0028G0023 [Parcubacteria group bacterium GW2011_GWD2_42_14]|nr:MAG: hypothetical protein UU98_C0028G0023 [Parcubacteria group bacterium GW2011_GWD2_42_14]